MSLVRDHAITLAVSDYSETSQVVCLLSEGNGLLRVLAKGSKRPRSAFGGPIDKLQLVQAVFSVRRHGSLGVLAELSVQDDLPGLRRQLDGFYAASYAADLVQMGMRELDPCREVFSLLRELLRDLSRGGSSAILLYQFEIRLLRQLGFGPRLDSCAVCGRKRPPSQGGSFSAEAGGLLCRRCRKQEAGGLTVGGKAIDALLFLEGSSRQHTEKVRLSPETARQVRQLLRSYWAHVLGREPRSTPWVPVATG